MNDLKRSARNSGRKTPTDQSRGLEKVGPDYGSDMLPFREIGTTWPESFFRFLSRLGRRELALTGTLISFTFISWQLLRAETVTTSAAWCVGAISLMILAMGMTALVIEDKSNAANRKGRAHQETKPGDG